MYDEKLVKKIEYTLVYKGSFSRRVHFGTRASQALKSGKDSKKNEWCDVRRKFLSNFYIKLYSSSYYGVKFSRTLYHKN